MTIDTKALRERFITEVERFGRYYCVDYFAGWSVEYDWIDPEYPAAEIRLELMTGESRTVPLCLSDRDGFGIDIGDAGTLDADGYGLMSYLWNEAEQQNRKDADRLEALEAENQRLRDSFPVIALGRGAVEVAEGTQEGVRALVFGKHGTGVIGEPTGPSRAHKSGETLAVVTFTSVASLDVVLDKLAIIRRDLEALAAGGDT